MNDSLRSLLERAHAEEHAGLWPAAAATYEAAYAEAAHGRDARGVLEVVTRAGHCHRQAGDSDLAETLLGLSLTLAELQGEDGLAARALNGLAILRHNVGDVEGAEALYLAARDHALAAGNEVSVGETEQNLGILANIRGRLDEALAYYESGLEHLRKAGTPRACASVLNNMAMLHLDLRHLEQADALFEEAMQICAAAGDVVTVGVIHINRAELFLARGEPDRARESCDQGFEIFSRVNDELSMGEALKFYGIIYRTTGKLHLADRHLRQAIETAAGKDPLLEAEAQRELALVLRMQGRNREAMEALNRAHLLFRTLHAEPDHAEVGERIGQLENDFLSLVSAWGESIEAKDMYTSGHCARVADYACRLAQEAGMPPRELVWFRMGAFLHDLGKTEVPEAILNKPGRLSDEERRIMERHPVAGDEMLASVEFPWDVRPMVRWHHERWDGMGYPDGLAGDTVPLPARILRIADVFDALTSTRSYRRPLTPAEAMQMMEDDVGSFDPALFELFRTLVPELSEIALRAHRTPEEPASA
ncbi:MAG TPA: HD domain-containing phosphohydrolase [Longimicrobiaceae bacterium]|jgi:putative nucleotidyltransferase with HDIG domain|nr:HD domain-containing phosphohydrolase [Longimicrobiaceae bacterium]